MRNPLTDPNIGSTIYRRAPLAVSGDCPSDITAPERSLIVKILLDMAKYGPEDEEQGIDSLLKDNTFEAAYPLHDSSCGWTNEGFLGYRQLLVRYWTPFQNILKAQPIQLIEKYYGTEAAFYFAFMEFYTCLLFPIAMLGLFLFIVGAISGISEHHYINKEVCESDIILCPDCEHYKFCSYSLLSDSCTYTRFTYLVDNAYSVIFAILLSVWGTLLIILWEREEKRYQYKWDIHEVRVDQTLRVEFRRKFKKYSTSGSFGSLEAELPLKEKYLRMLSTTGVCLLLVVIVFAAILAVMTYRLAMLRAQRLSSDQTYKQRIDIWINITGSIISVIFMILFDVVYDVIVYRLTEYELPRTQWEFDNSYVYKLFAVKFANNYGPLFYLAFFKGKFYTYPGDKHQWSNLGGMQGDICSVSGCMGDLAIQLFVILLLMNIQRNARVIIRRIIKNWYRKRFLYKCKSKQELPLWEQDLVLSVPKYYHFIREYLDAAIMYGYMVFFVAALPLAPLFLFVNNLFEIRCDAQNLCNYHRRTVAKRMPGLGAWLHIFKLLTYLGAVTNAFVIAFTANFIPRMLYRFGEHYNLHGFINSTLSVFAVSDYPDPSTITRLIPKNVTTCYYQGYRYPPDHPKRYSLSRKYWIILASQFIFVLVFEHLLFTISGILKHIVPALPKDVKQKMLFEKQQLEMARLTSFNEEYGTHRTVKRVTIPKPKRDVTT